MQHPLTVVREHIAEQQEAIRELLFDAHACQRVDDLMKTKERANV